MHVLRGGHFIFYLPYYAFFCPLVMSIVKETYKPITNSLLHIPGYLCEFSGVGETPNLVTRLFQNQEDPGDEVGERLIFGLPHGICPRSSRCIFLLLKLRYFCLEAQNGKKSCRGIINLSKEDIVRAL